MTAWAKASLPPSDDFAAGSGGVVKPGKSSE